MVALKRIQPERLHDAARRRFLREAEITAGLQHPGIVPIYGLGHDAQGPFYTMPLVDGQTFQEAIAGFHADQSLRRESGPGSLRFRELLQRFVTVCDTVAYAHDQGYIHRDLKPSNIMLGRYGETLVMDWGLAKHFGTADCDGEPEMAAPSPSPSPNALTATGAVLGTPQYMSPEQAKGLTTGPSSDVFNLGLILYTILTGTPAFQDAGLGGGDPLRMVRNALVLPPRQHYPRLARALESICLKALSAQPEDRYASARDLGRDLERWMADEPVSVYRRHFGERLTVWARRHRAWVQAGSAALVLVTAVSIIALLGMDSERRKATESARAEAAVRKQAVAAEADALAALHQAKKSTALLTLDTGLHLCDQGQVSHGILHLARSLRELPDGEPDLDRVIRANLGVWGRETHRLKFSVAHPGFVDIDRIAFHPDGHTFVTAGHDNVVGRDEIRRWDVATGKPAGTAITHPIGVRVLAISPNGKTFLTASSDPGTSVSEVRLWEGTPDDPSSRLLDHPAAVLAAVFSADEKTLLTACDDGHARLWEVASGKPVCPPLSHKKAVEAVALSADSEIAVTGSRDRTVQVWRVADGKPVGVPLNHPSEVFVVALSPDGKLIASASRDGTARLWDVATGNATGVVLRHPYSIRDNDSSLQSDSDTRNQTSLIKSVAFSPDSKTVLTGSIDATARLWDVGSGKLIGEPFLHEGDVNAVAFSRDGATILTSTIWKTHLWDVAGIGQTRLTLSHPHWVGAVAFSPDGKWILTGSVDPNPLNFTGLKGQVQLWDASNGTAIGNPLPHRLWILSVAFSPDGRRFLTGGGPMFGGAGEARLWQTATRSPIGSVLTYDEPIYAVAFSPDGRTFLTAGRNKLAQLYDADSMRVILVFGHENNILSAAFSPDGKTLLTGDDRGTARRWNVATGEMIGERVAVFGLAKKNSSGSHEPPIARSENPVNSLSPGRLERTGRDGRGVQPRWGYVSDRWRQSLVRRSAFMGYPDRKAHGEGLSSSSHGSTRGVQSRRQDCVDRRRGQYSQALGRRHGEANRRGPSA